jgi:hypothetical protein
MLHGSGVTTLHFMHLISFRNIQTLLDHYVLITMFMSDLQDTLFCKKMHKFDILIPNFSTYMLNGFKKIKYHN